MRKNKTGPIRVMMVTYECPPTVGGVSHAVAELTQALDHYCQIEVIIAACEALPRTEMKQFHDEWNGHKVFRIKYTGLPRERVVRQAVRTTICFIQLTYAFLISRPDILICHRVFDLAVFGGILARCFGRLSVGVAHGPEDGRFVKALSKWRMMMRVGGKLSHEVVANNTEDGEYLSSLLRKGVHVIPNIVHVSARIGRQAARKKCGFHSAHYHVLFVGSMHEEYGEDRKGLGYAIRAVARIRGCVLHAFGRGPLMDGYKVLAEKEGCSDRVLFHGKRDHADVNLFMCAADLLVVPSLAEGCPMVVLEAMELGLPVASTQVNGLSDLIRSGETGLTIRERDVESIVSAIRYGKSHRSELSKLANRAKRHVRKYANAEIVARQFHLLLGMHEDRRKEGSES